MIFDARHILLTAACLGLGVGGVAAAPSAGLWELSVEVASGASRQASQGQFCLARDAAPAGQSAVRPIIEAALDLHAQQQGQAGASRDCRYLAASSPATNPRWQVDCKTPVGDVIGQGSGQINASTLRLRQTVKLRGNTALQTVVHTVVHTVKGRRIGDCPDADAARAIAVNEISGRQRKFLQIHRACCGRYPAMNQLGVSDWPANHSHWLM